jgi:hypothetical protein
MEKNDFREDEMIEALERSGYLLESEIVKYLASSGFFVESNQVIKDPHTGKSREIDLTAEYYQYNASNSENRCATKVRFVFEVKNNIAPIVLLTRYEPSPNIEDYLGLKQYFTVPSGISYAHYDGFMDPLIESKKYSIFTQYCSFQKKKANEDLMALHPDNIHDGLGKICQFCEENTIDSDESEPADGCLRHFLYLPVLLINDNLFELSYSTDDNIKLLRTETAILVHNYHFENVPSMAFIPVITKRGFPDFLQFMIEIEQRLEKKMIELRIK